MAQEDAKPQAETAGSTDADQVAESGSATAISQQRDRLPNTGLPDQRTVISKRDGGDSPSFAQMSPKDLRELGNTLEGQQLEHFQLEEFVGGGGMGAVFRAMDLKLNRTVAVKVLSRNQSDAETLSRFKNEAQSAARLDHPNIAHVYYVGEDDGWHFIVFEFVDGVNIRDLVIQKGPLTIDEALSYTQQVALALSHAAKRDVVHRDIKPSNLLVTEDGQAKLVDMGLARLHQVEASSADLTASGVTLGTFDYISPEQARDPRNTDVRSDLYSLGCTLFFMLVERPPFPGGTVLQKLLRHSSEPHPDLRQIRPSVPEGVAAVVDRLLAKRPDDRFQSPEELNDVIGKLGDELSLPSVDTAAVASRPPEKEHKTTLAERHASWLIPCAFMGAVLLALSQFDSGGDLEPLAPQLSESVAVKSTSTKSVPPSDDTSKDERPKQAKDESSSNAQVPESNNNTQETPVEGTASPGEIQSIPPMDSLEPPTDKSIVVVLAEQDADMPVENGNFVGSFDKAIELANRDSNIREIEIWQTGEINIQPVVLYLKDRSLTIRSGPYGRVRLSIDNSELLPQPKAFHVHGGSLQLANVEVFWNIDQTRESWSMFYLEQGNQLGISDSILSVKNESEPVAFIDVAPLKMMDKMVTDPSAMGTDSPEATSIEPTVPHAPYRIVLQNVIARGNRATFLRTQQIAPTTLEWENGLLATTDRLVEIHGSSYKSIASAGEFNMTLTQVTTRADQGISWITADEMFSYLTPIRFTFDRCLLATKSTSLFTQDGHAAHENAAKAQLIGTGNWFRVAEDTDILLRLDPQDGNEAASFSLAEVQQNESDLALRDWYPAENDQEAFQRIKPGIWPIAQSSSDRSDSLESELPKDYLLKPAEAGGEIPDVGMDLANLPKLDKDEPSQDSAAEQTPQ